MVIRQNSNSRTLKCKPCALTAQLCCPPRCNDYLHAISTCRYNSAVGIEMIDNITQTEHRFDSTASVGKFGLYNMPVDLLYILNVILLYALRIVMIYHNLVSF